MSGPQRTPMMDLVRCRQERDALAEQVERRGQAIESLTKENALRSLRERNLAAEVERLREQLDTAESVLHFIAKDYSGNPIALAKAWERDTSNSRSRDEA